MPYMPQEGSEFPRHTPDSERPGQETYEVSGIRRHLEKLEKDPERFKKFAEGARARADDMYESGGLAERLKDSREIAYIGAGSGHTAQFIEEKIDRPLILVDLEDIRTSDVKAAGGAEKKFVKASARRLPFKDSSLDTVCLFDILHHVEKQDEILAEVLRVLKTGGRVLVIEDTVPEPYEKSKDIVRWLVAKMDDLFNLQPKGVNPHNYHSISDWEEIFSKAGFEAAPDKTNNWYWGLPDFLGAKREERPEHRTLLRPFECTLFEIRKPEA